MFTYIYRSIILSQTRRHYVICGKMDELKNRCVQWNKLDMGMRFLILPDNVWPQWTETTEGKVTDEQELKYCF